MDFVAVVDQVITLLRQRGRVAYRTLKRQFQLEDEALEDLKIELIDSQRVATDEQGTVLVWTGAAASSHVPAAAPAPASAPLSYTLSYLAEKILTSRSALEGERKQVTVQAHCHHTVSAPCMPRQKGQSRPVPHCPPLWRCTRIWV